MMKQLLLFLLLSASLFAVEITDELNVRGFGTLDGTLNTSENSGTFLPNGARDKLEQDKPNFHNSVLGAQLEWDVTDSADVMLQGIYSKRDSTKAYEPTLEWALLGYDFAEDYRLRLGKMKVPFMRGTELRYVDYAFLWARPQIPINGVNGFDDLYGADLIKNSYVGDVDLQLQLTLGQADHRKSADENKYLYNVAALASYEGSWLRLSAGQALFDHYNPQGKLIDADEVLTFISAETQLRFDDLTLYGGYGFNSNNAIPNERFYYASVGYEVGSVTPYLLYSDKKITNARVTAAPPPPGPPPPGPPPPPRPPTSDGYISNTHQAIGFRYDIESGVALKAEYDFQTQERRVDFSGVHKSNTDVFTLSLDVVF